jgi:hypothetical protein
MTNKHFTTLFCMVAILLFDSASLLPAKTKPATSSSASKFAGRWKGSETCADASAPVALLIVTAKGSNLVLSGIYSIQGQIKAIAKGDTIVIDKQEVTDPNFMNLIIEGKLAYTTNPTSISGKVSILNNQKKDECLVKYYK